MCASTKTNLESVEDFILNQDKIVTYRWLSNKLKVHTNTAKQLLHTFSVKNKGENLTVTYLISGQTEDGEIKVFVVKQSAVDKVKSFLNTVLSEHVYSVQKTSSSISSSDLYLADALAQDEDNAFSSIASRIVEQRELKIIIHEKPATTATSKPVQASAKPQQKEQVKPSLFNSKTNAAQKKKDNEDKETKETETKISNQPEKNVSHKNPATNKIVLSPTKNAKKLQSKSGNLGAMFSKQNALNAEKKKNESPPKKIEDSKETPAKLRENEPDNEDEESFDESNTFSKAEKTVLKTPVSKLKKKKNIKSRSNKRKNIEDDDDTPAKRRKRIVIASDSESEDGDEEEMDIEEEPQPEPESSVQAEVPDSDEEVIPPTPFEGRTRCRIRKQIDRTYTDDDGFIITKKEYVYESCSEEEKDLSKSNDDSETPKKSIVKRLSEVKEKEPENKNDEPITDENNTNNKSITEESPKKNETKITETKGKTKGKNEKKSGKGKSTSPKKTSSKNSNNNSNKQKSITSFFKKM